MVPGQPTMQVQIAFQRTGLVNGHIQTLRSQIRPPVILLCDG